MPGRGRLKKLVIGVASGSIVSSGLARKYLRQVPDGRGRDNLFRPVIVLRRDDIAGRTGAAIAPRSYRFFSAER